MIPSGKDTHIFTGVMDMDTEARYFAAGNYRYLLNARTSINTQGTFGAVEDVMGNVLVTNPYLSNGRNKVIGSCEDIAGQSCIYFVWNEFGYHGIFRWYANRVGFPDGVIETIYQVRFPNLYDPITNPNPLSFDENKLITGVNLVDELLYWTDYNREPKVINIVRANNTNKKLSFNFYIDTADLTVATTYNFSLFLEGTSLPIYGIAITSSLLTLERRIINIIAQLNADPLFPNYLTCVNKNQYIEFTCVNVGNYYLTAFNTGVNQCIVLPENHYPDYISGTISTPPPLTEDVLKRVKYPPFCAPKADYEGVSSGKLTQVSITPQTVSLSWYWGGLDPNYHYGTAVSIYSANQVVPSISTDPFDTYFIVSNIPSLHPYDQIVVNPDGTGTGFSIDSNYASQWTASSGVYAFTMIKFSGALPVPASQNQVGFLGFASEVNDYMNIVKLGASQLPVYDNGKNGPYFSYISVTQSTNLSLRVNLNLSVDLQQGTNSAVSFELWLDAYDPIANNRTNEKFIYKTTVSVTNAIISQTISFTAQPGKHYGIGVYSKGITTYWSHPDDLNQYLGYKNGKVKSYTINAGALDISKEPLSREEIYAKSFLFRNKYFFNDNEQSVLSAISVLPLPNTNVSKSIIVNYDDKWLTDVAYLSTIKYVDLYVSNDNGLTWNQWQRIEKWRFSPMMNRVDAYDNKEILTTVSPEEAILPYHSVPLKSKTQEYIDDRIWDGAIVEGYDNAYIRASFSSTYKVITNEDAYNNTPYLSVAGFRYGYEGYVGIVYYDNADRKSGVNVISKDKFIVPLLSSGLSGLTNILTQAIAPFLTVIINSEPPDWATKYQIVITKDLAAVKTLVWIPSRVQKVDVNFISTTTNPRYWEIDLDNISYYIDHADLGTEISYTFQKGDRVRMLAYGGGQVITTDFDMQILAAVANKVYVEYDSTLPWEQGSGTALGLNCYIEIYSGEIEATANEATFYEIGQCYEIAFDVNNKKYHTANFQNQDYATGTPATIQVFNGGIYYRKRLSYIYSGSSTNYVTTGPAMIWSGTINDFNGVDSDGFGRVNVITNIGQQYRYSTFRFSDQYQEVLNGLSANQPSNFMQMNLNYGDLNKMQVVNNDVLKLIFGNSYQVSIYVNQGVIRQSQSGPPIISVSDQVAGNSHVIQRTLGTLNPESVYVNDEGDMFGYDENEGVVWIASGNGLLQISDRGMKSVFKQYSNQRKATGGISETPTVYDLYHDEYILTLGDMDGFAGVTIAYNKQKSGWTSYYSFVPEYYGRVRDYVVSFKDGQLWKHDASLLAKNFYGVQYTRQLKFVDNKDFPKVKEYKALSITGIGKNDAPTIFIPPYEGVPTGMLSSLSARFFQTLEGIQYSNLQKDKLSPGFGGNQLQALVNGRSLKGQTIEITLENTDITKSSIYSADVVYFYSENS